MNAKRQIWVGLFLTLAVNGHDCLNTLLTTTICYFVFVPAWFLFERDVPLFAIFIHMAIVYPQIEMLDPFFTTSSPQASANLAEAVGFALVERRIASGIDASVPCKCGLFIQRFTRQPTNDEQSN